MVRRNWARERQTPLPTVQVVESFVPRVQEENIPTGNPKLDAWHAVRLEWIANGGRVTPELLRLEALAGKAVDSRAVHS
jgi:hypothetical protein